MGDCGSNVAQNGGDFGGLHQPIYSQTPRLKATHKSPMMMYQPDPVMKRANSYYDHNFLPEHEIGHHAFYGVNHTVGELDVLDPGFDNLDGAVSLPDLGGISVDFANFEDYQRLE